MREAAGVREAADREPEVVGVLLVGEPGPACLHPVPVDGAVDEAWVKLQGLVRVAADRAELCHHNAVQRVRQLLEAPVGQVPARRSSLFVGPPWGETNDVGATAA